MALDIPFDNTYSRLPERFYTRQEATPVKDPQLLKLNDGLATYLGLDAKKLAAPDGVAMLAGNLVPEGADPLAQVYAGHQFGGWSPQLGDGRALLLGEVLASDGRRFDIQLKGSGQTPYSRMGDGRAWLGPVLREYVVSEAMHALGVRTTRSLAAVATGETVFREQALPGAVLTRVASSHIRVGTFQFFASRQDREALEDLTSYVITRHYPHVSSALELLSEVIAAQAKLIARWMSMGFIHGVMNTDNSHIAGETIDYGPCAFLDEYHPLRVYSSIDHGGRYAFGRQPDVGVWNMAQLATSLLPLIHDDHDTAVKEATEVVHRFPDVFQEEWARLFRAKIGLAGAEDTDIPLLHDLLNRMAAEKADFTNTFRNLGRATSDPFFATDTFKDWKTHWQERLSRDDGDTQAIMDAANPAVIPRNHQVERVIAAGLARDLGPFENLVRVLSTPFMLADEDAEYASPPLPDEVVAQTFCGT